MTKINEPFQFLAEIEVPVKKALNIDTFGLFPPKTMFGYKNENWKPFTLSDGTTVHVSGHMQWDVLENGDVVQYPQGNRSALPSGKMPKGGSFFDAIVRQDPIVEERLDPKEFAEQTFHLYTDGELSELEKASKSAFENTDYSLVGSFLGASFSRMTETMGPYILDPKGIRDPEEWFVSLLTRKNYVLEIHNYQYEIGMKNLEMYKQAVGERIDVVVMSGTDFGMQNGPMFGVEVYKELFKPFHKKMNAWVHKNTNWKTFFHTCGSVWDFLDDFHEAEVDILNPVQISAAGMDPTELKKKYGKKFVFWGGGVDTQNVLPFESEANVRAHVRGLLEIFSVDGGYVFSTVHNIQDKVPIENVLAVYDEINRFSTK
jgi:uroporphyrinogen-III decarboxylase